MYREDEWVKLVNEVKVLLCQVLVGFQKHVEMLIFGFVCVDGDNILRVITLCDLILISGE